MRAFLCCAALFAFEGHARRVQTKSPKSQTDGNALVNLLFASNPAAAWQLGGQAQSLVAKNAFANNAKSRCVVRTLSPQMVAFDQNTLLGGGVFLAGVATGLGIIAFTESAGDQNDEVMNDQVCVECEGRCVKRCNICRGTGQDEYVAEIRAVKEAQGLVVGKANVVTVEDWAEGPKQVELFKELFANYPVKVTENVCLGCDGRGVQICDNCDGSGIQPRFLERFSPDDFMD